MTEDDYKSLRKRIDDKYTSRISEMQAKLEADRERELRILDDFWEIFEGQLDVFPREALERDIDSDAVLRDDADKMPLIEAVKEVIADMTGRISINRVIDAIETKGLNVKMPMNPTSVSGILRKLHTDGDLVLIERGKGQTPSIYEKN